MSAVGGNVLGTCTGTTPASLGSGDTALSFSGITIPASGSCTVIFGVTSNVQGVQPNTTSGVTTTETPVAGPPSNTANLTVSANTIAKQFTPAVIQAGGSSTVTLTLSSSSGTPQTNASFTDNLANLSAVGGAAGGNCAGANSNSFAANQTALSFSGITIPANSVSCTVTFDVTSSTPGVLPNKTSGVTSTQTPTPGNASNTANLTVLGGPTIAKAFAPTSILPGGTSTVTLTLSNSNSSDLHNASFTDTLVNMSAVGGNVLGTCTGTTPASLGSGDTAL